MTVVRVIRVLEYEYPSHEAAAADMANWGVPANGVRNGYASGRSGALFTWSKIRSATTFPALAEGTLPANSSSEEGLQRCASCEHAQTLHIRGGCVHRVRTSKAGHTNTCACDRTYDKKQSALH